MELKKQNSYLDAKNIFWIEFPPIAFMNNLPLLFSFLLVVVMLLYFNDLHIN